MSKKNGTSHVATEFVERLTADEQVQSEHFTKEKKTELVEVLREYMPEARKWLMSLPKEERDANFLDWILSMRVVEFKVEQVAECVLKAVKILETRSYNKSTRNAVEEVLWEINDWVKTI